MAHRSLFESANRNEQGEGQPPEILVVGNACIDRVPLADGSHVERLGGASAFAARAAALGGMHVGMVTAAGADFARLTTLRRNPYIAVAERPSQSTTTFEVYDSGPGQIRRERVVGAAAPLQPADIPDLWRDAPVSYVAPVLGECGAALVASLHSPIIVVGAQGWLREVDADGWVRFATTPEFMAPPNNTTAMVFSEADHPNALDAARALCKQGLLMVVTQGRRGGVILAPGRRPQRYVAAAAVERDATGAGDCFGLVFALGLTQKLPLRLAAARAARAAARVVEGPELGTLDMESVGVKVVERRTA